MSGVPRETTARVDVVLGWGRAAGSERQGMSGRNRGE
jgi:hypothetical protein